MRRALLSVVLASLAGRSLASNTIYVVACPDPAKDKPALVLALAKAAAKHASGFLGELGLRTQAKVFKGRFDAAAYGRLDKTDSVAFMGSRDAVVAAIAAASEKAAKSVSDGGFGAKGYGPEYSLIPREGFGDNIIAVSLPATKIFADATNVKLAEAAGFMIVHGAGHNANLQHAGDENGVDPLTGRWTPGLHLPNTPNIMSDAGVIVRRIESQFFAPELKVDRETLHMFVTAPGNRAKAAPGSLSIQAALIKRFDHDPPAAKLPVLE